MLLYPDVGSIIGIYTEGAGVVTSIASLGAANLCYPDMCKTVYVLHSGRLGLPDHPVSAALRLSIISGSARTTMIAG